LPGGEKLRKHWTGVAISEDGSKAFLTMTGPAQLWRFDFNHDATQATNPKP
jgi:sugar lactone lactonase YvrE